MTTTLPSTSETTNGQAKPSAPADPPPTAGPRMAQRRLRPKMVGLGVALIVLGGLFGWWLETRGGSQTVLVAAESIQAGKTVTTGQLATTEISGGANTSTIPSIHRDDIAGQLASSNIPAGTVLNPEQFAIKVEPDEGMSIVAVPVKSSQLPAIGLRPGDMVTVVVTASGKGAAGSGDGVEAGTTWQATVAAVGGLGDDGVRTIDVTLDTGAAEEVASAGGTGRLAIILNPSAR